MERKLNRALLEQTLEAKGFTQTSAASSLGVTKAAVSKWLTGKSFPRPPELLKLGKLLGLAYKQLVETVAPAADEPLIAFRKRASTKTTADHVARAKEMGRLLAPVVKHLAFDPFISPGRLKNPSLEYDYLQALVVKLRRELKLDPSGPVKFSDLIGKFKELQTVIVPVMWGQKLRHENALHIFLPESKTTWIYLNLDSHLHDFKFWMAHELGHVLAADLLTEVTMDRAEDFSDAFAGALLFPEPAAEKVYADYMKARFASMRLDVIIKAAEQYVISPNSVYKEMENYAKARRANLSFEPLAPKTLHSAIAGFNKGYPSVSENLFDGKKPSADHFMRVTAETFKTPIFTALGGYLKEAPQSDTLVSRILDVPLPDAKELRQALA
jgi:transcriptional regulator with XRE-family HTH domain